MNKSLYEKVLGLIKENEDHVIEMRRHLHQYPELSQSEKETARFVAEKLAQFGCKVTSGIAGYGVLGEIDTEKPGPVIAFRADMDALPMAEETKLPFQSKNEGVMHACGHDMHVAAVLGTAAVLSKVKDELNGIIKFIFQPAEELVGGAEPMIAEGVLENPKVDMIFTAHVFPDIPVGKIGVKAKYMSATDDDIFIHIYGNAAHSSQPEKGVNAIMIAANILQAFQTITTSKVSPFDIGTFTICKIKGGTAINVIADHVELGGMIRAVKKETKLVYRDEIQKIATGIADAMGGRAEVIIDQGYPPTYNDPALTDKFIQSAKEILGDDGVIILDKPMLGVDDAAFYQEAIPGVYFRLGAMRDDGIIGELHKKDLILHEEALSTGVKLFSGIALSHLT